MLTLIALAAALTQQTPVPPVPTQAQTRVMVITADGSGGLDKDGDGQVTREEFAAPLNDHFGRLDKDGDGRLSTEELAAGHGAMAGGEHDVAILRGPGGHAGPGVHRFELRRAPPGGEAGAGQGRTMVWSSAGAGPGGQREIVIRGGPEGRAVFMGPHGAAGPGERIEIRRMGGPGGDHDMDKDGDGRISEAEFTGPLREAFARMDVDSSGFIEAGERAAGHGAEVFVHRIEPRQDGED